MQLEVAQQLIGAIDFLDRAVKALDGVTQRITTVGGTQNGSAQVGMFRVPGRG